MLGMRFIDENELENKKHKLDWKEEGKKST